MNKLLIVFFIITTVVESMAQRVKIMTYNILWISARMEKMIGTIAKIFL